MAGHGHATAEFPRAVCIRLTALSSRKVAGCPALVSPFFGETGWVVGPRLSLRFCDRTGRLSAASFLRRKDGNTQLSVSGSQFPVGIFDGGIFHEAMDGLVVVIGCAMLSAQQ